MDRLPAALLIALLWTAPSFAEDRQFAERGHGLVVKNCGGCHAVEATGDSPLAKAPPFRTLHERYPVEELAEALAEGIVTGHPGMPQFAFESDEVGAIIAYMKTLEP